MLSWFFLSTWACQGRQTQGPAESVTESCPGSVWLIHLHTFQNSVEKISSGENRLLVLGHLLSWNLSFLLYRMEAAKHNLYSYCEH